MKPINKILAQVKAYKDDEKQAGNWRWFRHSRSAENHWCHCLGKIQWLL